ncbi:MAG: PLP-dependent aspartate aminotransferase family protein [Paenisporosarcina sp.]
MKNSFFSDDREICLHRFEDNEHSNGAIVPPTYSNTLFIYRNFEKLADADNHQHDHYIYSRGMNPTVDIVEKKIAALERGEQCKCFSSGMAAITAAMFNSVQSEDHILVIGNVYTSTINLLKYLKKFQVEYSIVYSTDIEAIKKATLSNTKMLYLESPTNLNFRLIDLKAVSRLAKSLNIRTVIDNTWATPLFQKPLTFGIDIVIHSASKYLGGHSDVMGGALITSASIMNTIFSEEFLLQGSVLVPDEATKLLKGLRTLPLRMKVHEESGLRLASFLETHEKVKKVHYPGLPSHPDFNLGKEQMTGYSGLLSFELESADFQNVAEVINKVKIFKIGVSWGSFESLIWSPNYGTNVENLRKEQINPGIIRIAVGQGDPDELIMDLKQALS